MMEALLGWPPPVLDPMGPYAAPVRTVAWALFVGGALVVAVVVAALFVAWKGPARWRKRLGGEKAVLVMGVAFPAVVLAALLTWGLMLTARLDRPANDAGTVRVTGEMWWFRVQYRDAAGRVVAEDANELRIPVGRPVTVELLSADVIHSFWVPHLSGKKDMIPGRTNRLVIQADRAGQFGGVCAEYCGRAHALMGMVVLAEPQANFDTWLQRRVASARAARPGGGAGEAAFVANGCAACHAIDGTSAVGRTGPNLTTVAARRTLGGGILPNNQGTLTGWIGHSQSIKPGNRMPNYDRLTPAQLQSLVAYLDGLK
jgi:cytochrome c oxidase subunit 2